MEFGGKAAVGKEGWGSEAGLAEAGCPEGTGEQSPGRRLCWD